MLEKRTTAEAIFRFDQHDNAFVEITEVDIIYDTETNEALSSKPRGTRTATVEELETLLSSKGASTLAQLEEARTNIHQLVEDKAAAESLVRLRDETIATTEKAAETAASEAEIELQAQRTRSAELETSLLATQADLKSAKDRIADLEAELKAVQQKVANIAALATV